ncbi:Regulator of cell morphogenesis and NO signaling [Minicystis rosea]|nr:Regulator of cell morphogenesis and NO signaling [Minicystis rosea]
MDALSLLKQQHREADALFAKLEKAGLDDKEDIFDTLADKLAIHTAIEEKHFYPTSLAAEPEAEELLREAVEEHLGMKRIIADLLETDAADPEFDAKVEVLKEQVQHHVEEEEHEIFPKVKKALGASKLAALGQVMEEMCVALEGTEPRNDIPRQTIAAAPVEPEKRVSKSGRRAA